MSEVDFCLRLGIFWEVGIGVKEGWLLSIYGVWWGYGFLLLFYYVYIEAGNQKGGRSWGMIMEDGALM
jgi:hypothetical protein